MLSQPNATLSNISASHKVVLMLFYNDLRVHDNATLLTAGQLASGQHSVNNKDSQLLCVYAPMAADINRQTNIRTTTQKDWGDVYHFEKMGGARQRFLQESLADLDKSLQDLGNRLLCLSNINDIMSLIKQAQVTDICVSHTADYAQNQVYQQLQQQYPQVVWHYHQTATLFARLPMSELPKSFTQFRKQIETHDDLLHAELDIKISTTPQQLPAIPDFIKSHPHYQTSDSVHFSTDKYVLQDEDMDSIPETDFKGGEWQALTHLDLYFNSDAPSHYKATRNALDEWTHSTKFSAWLANGSLSVNILLNRLRQYEREVIANESTYWIWFELLWREYFYWYAQAHQQNLFLFQGIRTQRLIEKSVTQSDKKRLAQWQNGTTDYPIVNACMRQLNSTGYMSNRGRQIVASAFIHELGLDWRYGATYFEQHLVDYDVASNWGNWQYLAGVGADPRGCRQFNLVKQTEQHDPNGSFIKKWQGNIY